jgi:hypothetical protein
MIEEIEGFDDLVHQVKVLEKFSDGILTEIQTLPIGFTVRHALVRLYALSMMSEIASLSRDKFLFEQLECTKDLNCDLFGIEEKVKALGELLSEEENIRSKTKAE